MIIYHFPVPDGRLGAVYRRLSDGGCGFICPRVFGGGTSFPCFIKQSVRYTVRVTSRYTIWLSGASRTATFCLAPHCIYHASSWAVLCSRVERICYVSVSVISTSPLCFVIHVISVSHGDWNERAGFRPAREACVRYWWLCVVTVGRLWKGFCWQLCPMIDSPALAQWQEGAVFKEVCVFACVGAGGWVLVCDGERERD